MQKIQTFVWFNDQAEEAANLYTSIFKNSKMLSTMPGPGGKPMGVTVQLEGQEFILFNGGPQYHPTAAISFSAYCQTESEIDSIWDKLSGGGTIRMELQKYPFSEKYGWVEDKFGVNWQLSLSKESRPIAPSFLFAGSQPGSQQGKAEEAVNFWTKQFPDSNIGFIARYEKGEGPEGQIKFSSFSLMGEPFVAMDSGRPMDVMFTPGISMFVNVETQAEVDNFWDKLSEGGRTDRCGWLQDKFGVSWQIVPTALGRLMSDKDRKKAGQVMQAMLKMTKLDIAELEKAYAQ
jgi:predicted 3-demethylubiquinone-9 3-methyltransferase (glyoxalase superfamily)